MRDVGYVLVVPTKVSFAVTATELFSAS